MVLRQEAGTSNTWKCAEMCTHIIPHCHFMLVERRFPQHSYPTPFFLPYFPISFPMIWRHHGPAWPPFSYLVLGPDHKWPYESFSLVTALVILSSRYFYIWVIFSFGGDTGYFSIICYSRFMLICDRIFFFAVVKAKYFEWRMGFFENLGFYYQMNSGFWVILFYTDF